MKECVEDKEIRKRLFNILRKHNYVEPFIEGLRELNYMMNLKWHVVISTDNCF